jgi:hypothetical protein
VQPKAQKVSQPTNQGVGSSNLSGRANYKGVPFRTDRHLCVGKHIFDLWQSIT